MSSLGPKYGRNVSLCYMDTDSFVYGIETEDFYRDIAKDVEKRFDKNGYLKMITGHYPSEKIKK